MLDIEAIINRHLTDSKMEGKTFHAGHIAIDLHNAIEEIKRLRAEVDTERAAVMTFINERAEKIRFTLAERSIPLLKDISYCIERGEHRREEKP